MTGTQPLESYLIASQGASWQEIQSELEKSSLKLETVGVQSKYFCAKLYNYYLFFKWILEKART